MRLRPLAGIRVVSLTSKAYSGVTGITRPSSSCCALYSLAMNAWPANPATAAVGTNIAAVGVGITMGEAIDSSHSPT